MSNPEPIDEFFTEDVAVQLMSLPRRKSWEHDLRLARHCVLDWLGCTIAGSHEPVATAVQTTLVTRESSSTEPGVAVIGTEIRVSSRDAALANGTAAHALDFDDGHVWMNAHPSAPILSAAAALAQQHRSDGTALLTAVVRGIHAGTVLGLAFGVDHYLAGWHTTGTIGAFGAAAACASVLNLDEGTTAQALAIASSQAGGVKGVFGSMGKPLNAGMAASTGVLAALLARAGLRVPPGMVEGRQGQAWVQGANWNTARISNTMGDASAISVVGFKVHACCGATHATIDGLKDLVDTEDLVPEQVQSVDLHVSAQVLDMCTYDDPRTGLEAKFSLTHAAALALSGRPTTDVSFSDSIVCDPELRMLRERVRVHGDRFDRGMGTEIVVHLTDGRNLSRVVERSHDEPVELEEQWKQLTAKFRALVTPILGGDRADALVDALDRIGDCPDIGEIITATRPPEHSRSGAA